MFASHVMIGHQKTKIVKVRVRNATERIKWPLDLTFYKLITLSDAISFVISFCFVFYITYLIETTNVDAIAGQEIITILTSDHNQSAMLKILRKTQTRNTTLHTGFDPHFHTN